MLAISPGLAQDLVEFEDFDEDLRDWIVLIAVGAGERRENTKLRSAVDELPSVGPEILSAKSPRSPVNYARSESWGKRLATSPVAPRLTWAFVTLEAWFRDIQVIRLEDLGQVSWGPATYRRREHGPPGLSRRCAG